MRHRIQHRKLNRTSEHRKSLRRNMAQSLFEHGQVVTTLPKAKDLRPFVERLVTLAVKVRRRREQNDRSGSLSARREIHKLISDRAMIPGSHRNDYNMMSDAARTQSTRSLSGRRYRTGEPKGRLAFTAESVAHRLIERIAPRFMDRPGGYTRVIRMASRRVGDSSPLAMLQLVGLEESPGPLMKPTKTQRRRRADARYALAIRLGRKRPEVKPTNAPKDESVLQKEHGGPSASGETAATDEKSTGEE